MTKLLFLKLLRDMKATSGRMVLMVIAISLSLIAFSAMLYARTLVQTNTLIGYSSTNPASARITLEPGVPPNQAQSLIELAKAEPGVIDATMRSLVNVELQKEDSGLKSLQLFVAPPDDPMRIATFKIEQGDSWPPAQDAILIERTTLATLQLKVGDSIDVVGLDGKPKQLKIAGSVHDQSLALAGSDAGVGYIQSGSLAFLGRPPLLNQLAISVADQPESTEPSNDRDKIVATALGVAERLKANSTDTHIEQVAVPPPYEHPHQSISNTLLSALLAFGTLSLLLSAILIATMFNGLLTQQIPQIGIMKAIGARFSQILQLYSLMILLVAITATLLAFAPGLWLGRGLAQSLLNETLNIDIASMAIPWWTYLTTFGAGILVPLAIALPPLVRASRRTVREALDEHGVADRQGRIVASLYGWLGKLHWVDRTLLMAFRNLFRRRARFLLSVGLLSTAGAIFVSGLNLMAGFQAIPTTISETQHWDAEIRLAKPVTSSELTQIVSRVPGVTKAEMWNSAPTSIQNSGDVNVTQTYPDQGHGSLGLTAIPPNTTAYTPPQMLEGRWLAADESDAIVLPQTIRKTLPNVKVGDSLQLSVDDKLHTWTVVGIAKELAGGSCPCVSQASFEQATGSRGEANLVRITTSDHTADARSTMSEATSEALRNAGIKVQTARTFDRLVEQTEGHSSILVGLILLIASAIGIVGLIGLGSTMGTNIIERTREFGVMKAIGAPAATIRRLIIFEGVFTAIVSCIVAVIPVVVLTILADIALGNLFFNAPVPFQISLQAILLWIVIVIVGTTVATLAPAYRASKLTIREALAYL